MYQLAEYKGNRARTECPAQHGQVLLPMAELIAQAQWTVDELIDVLGEGHWRRCWSRRRRRRTGRRLWASLAEWCVPTAARRARFAFLLSRSVPVSPGCARRPAARGPKCRFLPTGRCKPKGRCATGWDAGRRRSSTRRNNMIRKGAPVGRPSAPLCRSTHWLRHGHDSSGRSSRKAGASPRGASVLRGGRWLSKRGALGNALSRCTEDGVHFRPPHSE